jgi:hypothetical protein
MSFNTAQMFVGMGPGAVAAASGAVSNTHEAFFYF